MLNMGFQLLTISPISRIMGVIQSSQQKELTMSITTGLIIYAIVSVVGTLFFCRFCAVGSGKIVRK